MRLFLRIVLWNISLGYFYYLFIPVWILDYVFNYWLVFVQIWKEMLYKKYIFWNLKFYFVEQRFWILFKMDWLELTVNLQINMLVH